jgi:hypothetical protein
VSAGAALEHRVRAVDGVIACTIDDRAVVHVLVAPDATAARVTLAVGEVVGAGHPVRAVGGLRPGPRWRTVAGDLGPVFVAVVAATVLAAGGAALVGGALQEDGPAGSPGVVVSGGGVAAEDVRTALPAPSATVPERREVLGEVVEAPPPSP